MLPQRIEIDEAVDGAQHVISGNVVVQSELSCITSRSPIIDGPSRFTEAQVNQQRSGATTADFFNEICQKATSLRCKTQRDFSPSLTSNPMALDAGSGRCPRHQTRHSLQRKKTESLYVVSDDLGKALTT